MTVEEAENMAGAKTSTEEPAASNAVADAEAPRTPLLCPAKGCGKTFATEGARYGHITADHIRCRDLNCVWVSPNGDYKGRFVAHNEQSENLHYQRSHGDLQGQVKKRPTAEPDTSTVTVRHVPPPGRRYDTTRSRAGGPEIGAAVLAARMARKMQVAAFAASAGVAENTVRRVEHGETVMVTNLLKITDSLGLNPDGTERGAQSVEDLADEVEVSFVDEPVDETALEVTTEQMEPVPDVHGVGESIGGMTTDDLVALAATITAELQRRADVATESGDWKRKFEDLEAKVSMIREVWEL
jgi:transcriptional regulator with XRE-family HTH domain